MKLFGNKHSGGGHSGGKRASKTTRHGFNDDTADLDISAVRAAYDAASADKNTDRIVRKNKKKPLIIKYVILK